MLAAAADIVDCTAFTVDAPFFTMVHARNMHVEIILVSATVSFVLWASIVSMAFVLNMNTHLSYFM